MGPSLSTFRLRFALLAAVMLSALSAAEATLGAAPLFDAAVESDRPVQLTPVKDRDSVQHRTARASDHASFDEKSPRQAGGDQAFAGLGMFDAFAADRAVSADPSAAPAARPIRLLPSLIDLPPPAI